MTDDSFSVGFVGFADGTLLRAKTGHINVFTEDVAGFYTYLGVPRFREVELTVLKALVKENLSVEDISKQMRKSIRAVKYNLRLLNE
ncbi:hypothetical protein EUAN_24030 [Andreesenia angusta]|uniref:Uncharacterized protein n=1 Tax=Andreesenia angusta TaxID=39480 RepID=A0A1S1V3G6_9FIRM|nr:hypothetical protein [Andreesenia angusta]OHW61246.1 hypothetical protein EUAN_24030 [Andreesenia angusta]